MGARRLSIRNQGLTGKGEEFRQGDWETRRQGAIAISISLVSRSPCLLVFVLHDVIPFVSAMKAVSRLISSSLKQRQLVAGGDEQRGQVAVVVLAVGERDGEMLARCRRRWSTSRVLLEQLRRGVAVAGHADVEHRLRADLLHHVGDVVVHQQLAALDDADLVADVGQLRQDVAGDHDRLAHRRRAA